MTIAWLRLLSPLMMMPAALACAVDVGEGPASVAVAPAGARLAAAPLTGTSAGADVADQGCAIVLRDVARPAGATGGYETACGPAGCFYVWAGHLDVDAARLAAGDTPHVLFQSWAGAREWWEVDAVPVEGAGAGRQRFAFRIAEHTVSAGMSTTSLMRTHLELVPFLRDAQGGRSFDHNRHADPFTNYVLTSDNGWAIHDDPAVCAAPSPPDWMGNVVARISRDSSHACNGGVSMGDPLRYDPWARERAAVRNLCFEVWEPGVTDWDNPDQWRLLDVQVHFRFGADAPWQSAWVNALDHVGNNARYAMDLSSLDPFRPHQCLPSLPLELVEQPGGNLARATAQLFFTVNGAPLRPAATEAWHVAFEQYAEAASAAPPCP